MKFLKIFGLTVLSILLFLSLLIFGLAFTINSTVLNPDFFVSALDKLDVSSLVGESLGEEALQEEFPEEFRLAIDDVVTKSEPLIKEQAGAAIHTVFDYLLGKNESLDLAITLGDTVLDPAFIGSLVDEVDISSLAGGFISERITEEIPEEVEEHLGEYVGDVIDDVIAGLEPWVKEQASIVIGPVIDYLLGKSQSLNVAISLEPVMENIKGPLRGAFLESPPPDLAGLSPAVLEQRFDEFFAEFTEEIPLTFEIDESVLGTEMPAQIAEALAEAEEGLAEARQYVGNFQLGYKLLIVFMVLLILGIVFINRQVRGATRWIGITFLIYGIVGYLANFFALRYITGAQLVPPDMSASLQAWVTQVVNDLFAPMGMFSIGLLVGGVVLVVVSFVYKPRQSL